MRNEPILDPEGDRIEAQERRERELEKGSHPSTWDPRPCPLCRCKPKPFNGELLCACFLPVVR